jgi:hypothetical protein
VSVRYRSRQRALPPPSGQAAAGRTGLDTRDQARRFRIMARRADGRVQLLTRNGTNFANRFPLIVAAVTVLPVCSCLIDGEAVVCDENGLAVFNLIRGYRHDGAAVLAPSTCLSLMARSCGTCRSRNARASWQSL